MRRGTASLARAPGRTPDSDLETQRREQLRQATMQTVAEVGVEKTTVWMVAKRAGVSTGMVLYYYPSKKELLNSAVEWAISSFVERLNETTEGRFGPERLLESMKLFLHDSSGVIPDNFLIQYRMAALNDPEIRARSLEGYKDGRDSLAKAVRTAKTRGQIGSDVPDYALADLIYTLANGLAAELAAHPEIMTLDRALDMAQIALNAFSTVTDEPRTALPAQGEQAASASTADLVERLLLEDANLSERTSQELAKAFRGLYDIASRESSNN